MAMVDIVTGWCGCLYRYACGSKPLGLVQRSAATWCHAIFITWTKWTLAMALPWCQAYKHCPGYYYFYYYYY